MEILGIGMPELIFIVIIALIILGPRDMQKAGKTIGKFLRDLVTSDSWKVFQQTSRELRTLPNKLMREANEELDKLNKDIAKDINASSLNPKPPGPSNTPPRSQPYSATPAPMAENTIAPAVKEQKEPESDTPNNA
ncbi:MAG: hypothetical protein JNK32_14095 [Anaerolineales bacterium]|nr:hypothetical protein [Anaerolineales bacterium]